MAIKAVVFDFIGTLVSCQNYTMEDSRQKLYTALVKEGFNVEKEIFLKAYIQAHEKYRKIRYEQLKEVTNAIWVAETLRSLGFKVTADNHCVKVALNVFFQDFIDTLELRKDAKKLIKLAKQHFKVGLISNFTYAPVIYKSLRKTGINRFFDAIVVSEEIGWRKPSNHIFQYALNRLQIQANEALFIGDNPIEDVKGASEAGLKTLFIPSQFNSLNDLLDSKQEPDYIREDLKEIVKEFELIIGQQ